MLLSSSSPFCPAPLRCARTFCRRSRYLSKEPALVLNNTRVPTKLLCPLRRHRGWTPHRRPCPLWKITSTVFPASAQIPWRVRRSISSDNRSQREKSSGLEFRTICLILLVPLPHSWSGKSEAERGPARDGSILPHHSIGTLRKDGIEVKIPATSGEVERCGGTRGQLPSLLSCLGGFDFSFRVDTAAVSPS